MRRRRTAVARLAVFAVCSVTMVAAQYRDGSPEATILALFRAMYANDVAAFERLTVPHPQRSRLTTGGKRNEDRLRALGDDPASLQIKIRREFQ